MKSIRFRMESICEPRHDRLSDQRLYFRYINNLTKISSLYQSTVVDSLICVGLGQKVLLCRLRAETRENSIGLSL